MTAPEDRNCGTCLHERLDMCREPCAECITWGLSNPDAADGTRPNWTPKPVRTTPPADWTPAMWERHTRHLLERANRAEALLRTAAEAITEARETLHEVRRSTMTTIATPSTEPTGVMYADHLPTQGKE